MLRLPERRVSCLIVIVGGNPTDGAFWPLAVMRRGRLVGLEGMKIFLVPPRDAEVITRGNSP
jgi:hypothetical protein